MVLIRRYMRANARTLIAMALISAASAAVSMQLLQFINAAATDVLRGSAVLNLLQGAALLAAVAAARALAAVVAARFGAALVAALRRELCGRFLAMEFELLAQRKHAVFGALIGDVGRIAQAIQTGPLLLTNGLLTAAGIAYLAWLSPLLLAVVLPFIGLSGLLFVATQRSSQRSFDAMREAEETMAALIRILVEGKKELTLSRVRAEHFEREQLVPAIEQARASQQAASWRWGINDAWAEALGFGWVLTAVLCGRYLFAVPAEVVLQFVIAGLFINGPLSSLFDLGAQFAAATASLRHLDAMGLNASRPEEPTTVGLVLSSGWRSLQLERVSYKYPGGTDSFAFGPLDFTLARGETVFVTGGNGCGKSTLLLLLTGLIRPHDGRVLVDGRPIAPPERQAWRSLFSAVFFDAIVFRHALDARGQGANRPDVERWLARVQLDSKVQALDGTFSSIELSQGQRKRLALVQACLEDRDVMVFDEFTADQDKGFRDRFYRELLPELKRLGKTLVVVSHDDRYWHQGDRIISLDSGQLGYSAGVDDEAARETPMTHLPPHRGAARPV